MYNTEDNYKSHIPFGGLFLLHTSYQPREALGLLFCLSGVSVLDDMPRKVSSYLTLYSVDENHNAMHLDFIIDQTTKQGTYRKALGLPGLKFSGLL